MKITTLLIIDILSISFNSNSKGSTNATGSAFKSAFALLGINKRI